MIRSAARVAFDFNLLSHALSIGFVTERKTETIRFDTIRYDTIRYEMEEEDSNERQASVSHLQEKHLVERSALLDEHCVSQSQLDDDIINRRNSSSHRSVLCRVGVFIIITEVSMLFVFMFWRSTMNVSSLYNTDRCSLASVWRTTG